jgi:hypothetical protein
MQVTVTVNAPDAGRAGRLAREQVVEERGWARASIVSTRVIAPEQYEVRLEVSDGPGAASSSSPPAR